ncbi:hypothetical protein EsH8_X_000605 [Colletotrichum jinshuiense]
MDEKQAPGRPTGIPRLSRLPLPKPAPAPALRPSPSREGLNSSLRNPRLRPAASREQLAPTAALKQPEPRATPRPRREIPPPSARKSELRTPSATLRSVRSVSRLQPKESTFNNPPTPPEEPEHDFVRRTTSLSRRSPEEHVPSTYHGSVPGLDSPAQATSPPLAADDDADSELPNFDAFRAGSFKPRPSLSERTIETLSQLQTSPSLKKKSSAFFDSDGVLRPRSRAGSGTSRPGSSYTSDGSMRPTSRHSRPGSSSGAEENPFLTPRPATNTPRAALGSIEGTPSRRISSVRSLRAPTVRATPQVSPSGPSSFTPSASGIPVNQSPSPTKTTGIVPPSKVGTKTVTSRPLKPRASVNGLYKKPSLSAMNQTGSASAASTPPRLTTAKSYGSLRKPGPSKIGAPPQAAQTDTAESREAAAKKSSSALREQIAKAKAAKRAADRQATEVASVPSTLPSAEAPTSQIEPPIIPEDDGFDFGIAVSQDPFNTKRTENATAKIIQQRLGAARSSGRLNIAAMSLKQIPVEVLKMYDAESLGTYDGSWAETVDLARFVAADNELETIEDTIFPDVTPEEMAQDEDSNGNIFGGLEAMDLHGNRLISLPMGLRQLRLLTSLNLSQNQLANNCLDVITQVTALRDLKLANNLLYGPLNPSFSRLENLEIFDLHGNNVSSLPSGIENLSRLRILNLNENSFESLPFASLSKLPLTELLAKKNRLAGTLIEDGVEALSNLQMLDLSCNQLTRLVPSGSTIRLSSVHQLVLSMNRLQELPDVSSWTNLLTLAADENAIPDFPAGFLTLGKLRHVDFSANDIRVIPAEISRMDNLTMIRLSGNPLRDKKFVSATTEELKEVLAGRLEPPTPYQDADAVVPENTQPETTRDEIAQPEITELEFAQPEIAQAEVVQDIAEDDVAEDDIAQQEITPLEITQPEITQDGIAQDEIAQDEIAQEEASQPEVTEPETTQIEIIQPTITQDEEPAESYSQPAVDTAPPAGLDEVVRDIHSDEDNFATPPTSSPASPAYSRSEALVKEIWPVKQGGLLDRSNTKSSSLHPVICSKVAADNKVREVQLHHNLFTCFPNSLSFFAESLAALSLAHNQLVGESYLMEELELPALRELNLVSNHITSLSPLTTHLHAPQLEKMDVSLNRITALPTDLRAVFPRLVVLLAANNHLIELDPDTIKGMEVVDAGNNDITHLNPRIGLLGGSGGLKRLEVSGNRFRVPRWNVLERGTDATLRWLRGRVPVAEMASWKEGQADSGNATDTSLADVD